MGSEISRVVRQLRLSPMNVPQIWAAAGGEERTPVLEWLMGLLSHTTEVLECHEGNITPEVAVQTGWSVLRSVLGLGRSLIAIAESRFRRQSTREPHSSESPVILEQAFRGNARVALLESAYVAVAVLSRQLGLRTQRFPRSTELCTHATTGCRPIFGVPMLKRLPPFHEGEVRECFATALRERHIGALIGDSEVQVRAWKLFAIQDRRPQEQVREIPREVMEFVPERDWVEAEHLFQVFEGVSVWDGPRPCRVHQ